MYIQNECAELAKLLAGRKISFDFKSYDDDNDIPHIYINGSRFNVDTAYFDDDKLIIITTDLYFRSFSINYKYCGEKSLKDFNDDLSCIGVDRLIRDMYYETEESYVIGDFETEFLQEESVYVAEVVYHDENLDLYNFSTELFYDKEEVKAFMENETYYTANLWDTKDIVSKENKVTISWDSGFETITIRKKTFNDVKKNSVKTIDLSEE